MDETKRILILSTNYLPDIGGAELAIKAITDRLSEYHFDMVTSRLDYKLPSYERIGNINVFRAGGSASLVKIILPKIFLPLQIFWRSRALLKKNKYEAIFVSQASQAGGAVWFLRKLMHIKQPVILNFQEGRELDKQFFLIKIIRKLILGKADYLTAISKHLVGYLINNGINKNKIELIPNGVDVKDFSREFNYGELTDICDKFGIRPDHKVIISAGRLVYKNGVDLLIKAYALLADRNRGTKFKLLLPGNGVERERLEQLAIDLGVDDDVIFPGVISPSELPKYLAISHIFVRPSRSEGLGNAFLEAMAGGLPIIAPPVGGIPDFLVDGETGLFCKIENPESIAEKLQNIFEDKELYNRLIANGYKLVAEKYDWDMVAESYRQLFDKIIL